MAPKKKETQKLSLGEFMQDSAYGGSWADEVEDTFATGTQPLPSSDRRPGASSYGGDRGYSSIRENLPQKLPDRPPFTAHLGNLSYDATVDTVSDFFTGCNIVNVRIIEDREQNRPKGFAYAEFADLEGLKQALTLDGQLFEGRNMRIKVADPPKDRFGSGGGDSSRDLSNWTRKGPLEGPPPRAGGDRRGSGPDFSERRPREFSAADDGKTRDFGNWERKGPLSPIPQPERPAGSRDGSRARPLEGRSESVRNRRASPAWGPGEARQDGSRPPRREFSERPERPERVPTAAEKDTQWRSNMRPDPPAKSPGQSREGSEAPPSPAAAPVQPAGRPKLNLTKRTVSEAPAVTSPALSTTDNKASPFGAARPIDTATREREIEEKRVLALKQKKEADEKAKEERRLAKEAAAKEAAEKAAAEKAAAEKAAEEAAEEAAAKKIEAQKEASQAQEAKEEASQDPPETPTTGTQAQDGEKKTPSQSPNETRSDSAPAFKSRAAESGNWRQPSGEPRGSSRGGNAPAGPRRGGGPPRGPRGDGGRHSSRVNGGGPPQHRQTDRSQQSPSEPAPATDEDGWTIVPNKNRRGQNPRPPIAS